MVSDWFVSPLLVRLRTFVSPCELLISDVLASSVKLLVCGGRGGGGEGSDRGWREKERGGGGREGETVRMVGLC